MMPRGSSVTAICRSNSVSGPAPDKAPARLAATTASTRMLNWGSAWAICTTSRVSTAGPSLPPEGLDLKRTVGEMEQRLVEQAMERTGGNQTLAAQLLGLSRDELRYRLNKYRKESGDSD